MAHPWYHAERSARLFGGKAEDYLPIHDWFDESKAFLADVRHRSLRHHTEGIFLCERIFGTTIENSENRRIPVRTIGEQHVKDDLGWIPTVKDWLVHMQIQPWMGRTPFRPMKEGTSGTTNPIGSADLAPADSVPEEMTCDSNPGVDGRGDSRDAESSGRTDLRNSR